MEHIPLSQRKESNHWFWIVPLIIIVVSMFHFFVLPNLV